MKRSDGTTFLTFLHAFFLKNIEKWNQKPINSIWCIRVRWQLYKTMILKMSCYPICVQHKMAATNFFSHLFFSQFFIIRLWTISTLCVICGPDGALIATKYVRITKGNIKPSKSIKTCGLVAFWIRIIRYSYSRYVGTVKISKNVFAKNESERTREYWVNQYIFIIVIRFKCDTCGTRGTRKTVETQKTYKL